MSCAQRTSRDACLNFVSRTRPHTQVPAFSFLLEIQPCLDGQSTEETEAATSVSETASSSSGALPAAGDPQTTADSTSAASDEQLAYDAVLLCAHTRCHALRALALQMQHPESAVVALRGGLLTPLLTLATTDLAAAPALALGRDAGAAMHLPVVSSLASKLSKMISCTELQSFAQRIWARIPLAPPATRTPWLRARAAMHLKQTLEPLGGEVAIEGFRVRAVSHFPTVRLKGISLCSGEGRWYYEVVLLTDGLMQIGWCDPFFRCDPVRGAWRRALRILDRCVFSNCFFLVTQVRVWETTCTPGRSMDFDRKSGACRLHHTASVGAWAMS